MTPNWRTSLSVQTLLAAIAMACSVLSAPAQEPADRLSWGDSFECLTASACVDACPSDSSSHPPAHASFAETIPGRTKLGGDWFGTRPALLDHGVTVDVSTTQFYQGVTTGGLSQSFPYGGRNDYFMTLDGEKLGLWKGGSFHLHGETRYGESANNIAGSLLPVNLQLALPAEKGAVTALTAAMISQQLSDNWVVYAGKYNTFDGYPQPLTWADRDNGFLNAVLVYNPIDFRTVPYVTYGAGLTYHTDDDPVPVLIFEVLDTNDATTGGFETFFNNGATLFTHFNLPTRFFGKPGHQGVSGAYSSGQYTNLSPSAYYVPLTGIVNPSPPKRGSWFVGYNFDQAVWVAPDDPRRVWGVFGKFGMADNNPSPIRWTALIGIAGASPLPSRPHDTFGMGYFYLGLSDVLKGGAELAGTPLRNEQGFEWYYNARITPWLQVTPDLQVIVPFQKSADTALLAGLRAKIDF